MLAQLTQLSVGWPQNLWCEGSSACPVSRQCSTQPFYQMSDKELNCTVFAPIEDCRSRGEAPDFGCGVDCLSIRMLSSGEPCTAFLRKSADAGLDILQGGVHPSADEVTDGVVTASAQ